MYAYLIDDWVYDRPHKKNRDRLDLLLTQQGITGRTIKLGRLSDAKRDIINAIESGVRTLVAVGNDTTVSKVLNSFMQVVRTADYKQYAQNTSLGTIPFGNPCIIAQSLGFPKTETAITALATRRARWIDLGCLNKRHYFISTALFPEQSVFSFGAYKMSSLERKHVIALCNSATPVSALAHSAVDPSDGRLDAVIAHEGSARRWSTAREYFCDTCIPVSRITITHPNKAVIVHADREKTLSTPIEARIEPRGVLFVCKQT